MAKPVASGFKLGSILVDPPVLLAPMEDVTNLPFRLIAKRIAKPGMMFTEFVSAMAVHHNAAKTIKKMTVSGQERPLGIQIFGGDAETMAETARVAESMGADSVDINMGCWVPKVCKTGAGAALLKDPVSAQEIVRAVAKAVKVPVSVKVRAGWDWSLFAAPDLARRFQDAGAQMITLHARFAKQGFEGQADWKLIEEMRTAVTVPLIGNGDVKSPEDALRMFAETGCDGIMVGRVAISNPWALARIVAAIKGEPVPAEPSLRERTSVALEHLKLMIAFQAGCDSWDEAIQSPSYSEAEVWACRHLRGQLPLYVKAVHGAAQIRDLLYHCNTFDEVTEVLLSSADPHSLTSTS